MPRNRAPAGSREVRALAGLLACTMLLGALLAWRAYAALTAQRGAAARELAGEAEFAAYMFASHAGRDVYWGLVDLFAPVTPHNEVRRGGPKIPLAAIAADLCEYDFTCAIRDSVAVWFRLDLRAGTMESLPLRGAGEDSRTADSIRLRLRDPASPRSTPFVQIFDQRAHDFVAVVAVVVSDSMGPAAAYGIEVPARLYGAAMIRRSTGRSRPLLPGSLSRRSGAAPLYTLRLTDHAGRVLGGDTSAWEAGSNAGDFLARVPVDSSTRDLFAEVILRPAHVAARMTAATPQAGFAIVALFLALDVMVIGVLAIRLHRVVGESRRRAGFTASVSHELRTPLTQILLYGESLRDGSLRTERERRRASEVIVREARRLLAMIENLLRFSRAERSATGTTAEPVSVAAEVSDAVAELAWSGPAPHPRMMTEVDPGVVVVGDPTAVRQILTNLLDNAVKYGPAGQTVTVGCRIDDGLVRLWVDDQGPGVPASERDHVWEPFVRLEQESHTGVATGTGLGLAVVRQLAQVMGGHAWVEDAPGGGARFVVTLPGRILPAVRGAVA
jgi:signal transduction histidine kinase